MSAVHDRKTALLGNDVIVPRRAAYSSGEVAGGGVNCQEKV
jgi:hypothetical protein